jgi:transcriptional regulator with PAS, ATPase and Fis domain
MTSSRDGMNENGEPIRRDAEMPFSIKSAIMRQLLAIAARAASSDWTVLITGETGVGKERLARWIHDSSQRADKLFFPVNCGTFTDTLIESQLFGHSRGAFTGATRDSEGVFEAANHGTLFLDEIGEIPLVLQPKLLRVLENGELRRVGETRLRNVDVRIIAATNRDLLEELERHRFREDLYYRLRGIDLHVPPLRERPDDIRALAHDFLARAAARLGRSIVGYTPDALECIFCYSWPGNIRELKNAVERACAVAVKSEISVEDLPRSVRVPRVSSRKSWCEEGLTQSEREYILALLERNQGSRRHTAQQLRMSLSTLKRRLRALRENARG